MHGITVKNTHLDQVLAPVAAVLDRRWWYIGGAGMTFPSVRPPARLPPLPQEGHQRGHGSRGRHSPLERPRLDPVDFQRYCDESRVAREEYSNWLARLGDEYVGKPGFFSRYAAGMRGGWQIYFASDASKLEQTGLADAARRFNRVWFDAPPEDLPSDICLITRDVDAAYLDLFFRDEWMCRSVLEHAEAKGFTASQFRSLFTRPSAGTPSSEIRTSVRARKGRKKRRRG